MKNFKLIGLIAIIFIGLSSCQSLNHSMSAARTYVEFEKDDFSLSEKVEGEITQVKIIGIDWGRLFKKERADLNIPVIGHEINLKKVDQYALYKLIEENKGYDVVFYPTIKKDTKSVLGLYKKTTVSASARLGKLK